MSDNYQLLLDNISDMAWLIDPSGQFLVVNHAFLEMYHCSEDQIIGKTYFDIVDEKTALQYIKEDNEVLASLEKKIIECNLEVASDDGWIESEWLETVLTPAINSKGECIGVIGISRDITERKQKVQELEEHQEWLDLYFNVPLLGMAVIQDDFQWQNSNEKLHSMLGYSHLELSQKLFTDVLAKHSQKNLKKLMRRISALNQAQINTELDFVSKQGQILHCHVVLHKATDGLHDHSFVVMIDDITEQKDAAQKLVLANEVIEASSEAILITDHNRHIIRVNQAFINLTGYSEEEVLGKNPKLLKSGRNTEELYKNMWLSIEEKGFWQGEIWDRRKDGSTYPKWMTISSIYHMGSKQVSNYVAIFSDVTERKKAENKIKFMAYHDSLTGLANKTLLESRLVKAIIEAEEDMTQIALIQIDLDNFKTINDSMGHYIGDELLKEVAKSIKKSLRNTDLVARIGGDEFLIMLDKLADTQNVEILADKILKKFEEPINVLGYTMHVSLSIGICLYPNDGENHEVLLQNVDTAMNTAKSNGKNQSAFFNKEMSEAVLKRLKMEYQLRNAIKDKEFSLHYQPQVNLADNKIIGVEALIRWNSENGVISPIDFIPVAEETGLIRPIGEWVLSQACEDCMLWQEHDINVNIAVNLSALQFEFEYLTSLINKVLEQSKLPPTMLDLEITEGTLVTNTNDSIKLLKRLKELGIKVSIDDFGTGYSSLAYLKAFDIDKLKIDRSFIDGIPEDSDDSAITSAIISLAKSMNLKIVAEGAEEQKHIDFLQAHECDYIQGYFYAKPMPSDALIKFIKDWEANDH